VTDERRALWIYPWDILDAGIDGTVARAHHELGLHALSLASSYHSARFLLPRRSTEKVFLSEGSAVYFRPDLALYEGTRLRPLVTRRSELLDALGRTSEACHREGMTLRAWTVGLHNSRLGEANPWAVVRDAFDDAYPWALCPAQPEVRAYLIALVRDLVTNHRLDAIDLESAGYHGFQHGHHHELTGINWGPLDEFLMSLCFCPACLQRAGAAGIDGERLKSQVAALLLRRWAEEANVPPAPISDQRPTLALLLSWPELDAYVRMRLQTVTSLIAEVRRDAIGESGVLLCPTAITFYRGVENAWLEGVDLRTVAEAADELLLLAYFREPAEIARELQLGREMIGNLDTTVVGMSLLAPATASARNLLEKVETARASGATRFSFYNYGFVSDERLNWLAALRD
jgi:hypothetical protein